MKRLEELKKYDSFSVDELTKEIEALYLQVETNVHEVEAFMRTRLYYQSLIDMSGNKRAAIAKNYPLINLIGDKLFRAHSYPSPEEAATLLKNYRDEFVQQFGSTSLLSIDAKKSQLKSSSKNLAYFLRWVGDYYGDRYNALDIHEYSNGNFLYTLDSNEVFDEAVSYLTYRNEFTSKVLRVLEEKITTKEQADKLLGDGKRGSNCWYNIGGFIREEVLHDGNVYFPKTNYYLIMEYLKGLRKSKKQSA